MQARPKFYEVYKNVVARILFLYGLAFSSKVEKFFENRKIFD